MASKGKGSGANPSKYAGRVGTVKGTGRTTSVVEVPGKAGGTSAKPSTIVKGKKGSTGGYAAVELLVTVIVVIVLIIVVFALLGHL